MCALAVLSPTARGGVDDGGGTSADAGLAGEDMPGAEDEIAAVAALQPDLDRIYRKHCMSVVRVTATSGFGESVSTGFIIGDAGKKVVATVFTAKEEPESVKVTINGQDGDARIAMIDPITRLGLLEVDGLDGGAVKLAADGAELPLASHLFAITDNTDPLARAVEGRLAGHEKYFRKRVLPVKLLRINIKIGPGDLGSPLFARSGEVVGVVLLDIPDDLGSVFGLPIELVDKVYRDYLSGRPSGRGWLGISLEDGTTTPKVLARKEDGPADRAGVKPGDVVLRIGNRMIDEYSDVVEAMFFATPGVPTEFEFLRGLGKRFVIIVPSQYKPGPDERPVVEAPEDDGQAGSKPKDKKASVIENLEPNESKAPGDPKSEEKGKR